MELQYPSLLNNPWFWSGAVILAAAATLSYFGQSLARQFSGYHQLRKDLDRERELLYRMLRRAVPPQVGAALLRGEDLRDFDLGWTLALRIDCAGVGPPFWKRVEAPLRKAGWYPSQPQGNESRLYYCLPQTDDQMSEEHARESIRRTETTLSRLGFDEIRFQLASGPAKLRITSGLMPTLHLTGPPAEKLFPD